MKKTNSLTPYSTKLKKKWLTCAALSYLLTYGIALFLVIYALAGYTKTSSIDVQATFGSVGQTLVSLGVTIVLTIIFSIIVKDKITPTIWMFNIIMSCYLFNRVVMFFIFAAWIFYNYVLVGLTKHYKNKYIINKEIDKRG